MFDALIKTFEQNALGHDIFHLRGLIFFCLVRTKKIPYVEIKSNTRGGIIVMINTNSDSSVPPVSSAAFALLFLGLSPNLLSI